MKNLQHRSDARARVVHRNSDPVVIAQTLRVNGASKRIFNSEKRDKEGIESSRERERHTKRIKALNDWDIIKQKNKYALTLMGLLLTETAKPKAEGSPQGGGGNQSDANERRHYLTTGGWTYMKGKPAARMICVIVIKKNFRVVRCCLQLPPFWRLE
jgi:hypothetical protein